MNRIVISITIIIIITTIITLVMCRPVFFTYTCTRTVISNQEFKPIPKIIHQTWDTIDKVPEARPFVSYVRVLDAEWLTPYPMFIAHLFFGSYC